MTTVDAQSSDDDLYAWFIKTMAEDYGSAEEIKTSVIQVWSVVEGEPDPRPYELRVSREELRSVAYASANVFDDSHGNASVPAKNPMRAGLDAFTFDVQESMESGSHLSRTYEFDRGQMRRVHLD